MANMFSPQGGLSSTSSGRPIGNSSVVLEARQKTLASFELPKAKGVVFWPVGTGDSTTIVLQPGKLVMQIDLRHLAKAKVEGNPEWPIIDYLVKILPKKANDRPYLALFVLTHPDRDHVQGFEELLRRVDIGELWHTPRIFRDQADEDKLCDDAKAFRKEAHRRRKAIADDPDNINSGDRLRVIGHEDILNEDDYQEIPDSCKSRPADTVEVVDGVDLQGHFRAFIHAPFKDDQAKNRNNTSLSLNVVLFEGQKCAQFMFFGDREYPTIKQIYEVTEARGNEGYLYCNVMLCSHHCSKGIMFWQEEGDEAPCFKQDIMDYFKQYLQNGYIVSSSLCEFTDGDGDNPPHKKARKEYEKIVKAGQFLCTHEQPSTESPEPIVFTIDANGFAFSDKRKRSVGPAALGSAVAKTQSVLPPKTQTTFGGCQ